jgi:hypothetical protein
MIDKVVIPEYESLIEAFLNRQITVAEFERVYLDKYLSDNRDYSEELFQSLDWLFAEVDAYTDHPEKDDDDIDEDQLRVSCTETLKELQALKERN